MDPESPDLDGLPAMSWPSYLAGRRAEALEAILRLGFVLLSGVPTEPGRVLEVAASFGYVRETNYGRLFDVRVEPAPGNLAFTIRAIRPHTDNPYRDPVPTVQLLHCLRAAGDGGDTGLVDGFAAAAAFRAGDPESFGTLTRTPVPFGYIDNETELRASLPPEPGLTGAAPAGLLRRPGRPGQHAGRPQSLREPRAGGEPVTAIDAIAALFAGPGARDYLGEAVTIGEHMRQAGALAEAAGAAAPLVAAALLHDVGHLRAETDARHGTAGGQWLSQWFGPAVTEPVRLHVAAKRYLCAIEPGYFGLLSAESVRTLALQGGPMTPEQAAGFRALPYARDAVAVRRWDDEAKDPSAAPPEFGHFEVLLRALLERGPLSS